MLSHAPGASEREERDRRSLPVVTTGAIVVAYGRRSSHRQEWADRLSRTIVIRYAKQVAAALGIIATCGLRGSTLPRSDWVDPDTGHRVIRLSDEAGSQPLYFHDNAYSQLVNMSYYHATGRGGVEPNGSITPGKRWLSSRATSTGNGRCMRCPRCRSNQLLLRSEAQ